MIEKLNIKIITHFKRITGINCSCQLFEKGADPNYTTLLKQEQGVYVFYAGDVCFKVGKAGSQSQARWNSHHYNLDKWTKSALTKSISQDLTFFKSFFEQSLGDEILRLNSNNIKCWIKAHLSRIEFKISAKESKFTLSLLESLIQYYFNPVYEGKSKSSTKIKLN